MALTITHAKNVAIADDPKAAAAGEVLPSDWNASHTIAGTVDPSIGARTILSANTSYFVSTTGSDSNDGKTSGTAWATLQHAMTVIATTLDISGFTITVNIGAGSFVGFGEQSTTGGGQINWIGAGSTSTTLTGGPADGIFNNGEAFSAYFNTDTVFGFDKLKFSSTLSGYAVIGVFNLGFHHYWGPSGAVDLAFDLPAAQNYNAIFDGGSSNTLNLGNNGGTITVNYSPASQNRTNPTLQFLSNGTVLDSGITWQINGSPIFAETTPFFYANQGGTYNGASTFSGAASGPSLNLNAASIWANGNFTFPTSTLGFIDQTSAVLTSGGGHGQNQDTSGFGLADYFVIQALRDSIINSGSGSGAIAGGDLWTIGKASTDGPRMLVANDGGIVYVTQVGKHINTSGSTNYTLALLDQDGILEMNNAGANNATVPSSGTVLFPIGTKIRVVQVGAGATTVVAAGGVTVHNAGALTGQYASSVLYKRGADEWVQLNGAF